MFELQEKFGLDLTHVDTRGRTILHYAAAYQWASMGTLCNGKQPSWLNQRAEDGKTALHVAVECRTVRDNLGRASIHLAAEHGHRFIFKLLLHNPTREYGRDAQKSSLLHFLMMWESEDTIRKYIQKHRPLITVFDRVRRTPLHYAALYGNTAAAKVVLDCGADPYLKDASGSTPLHYALAESSYYIVQLLFDNDAYLWELDGYQRNALHLAMRSSNLELIDFILGTIEEQNERGKSDPRLFRS